MKLWNAMLIALSTYSRVPVPRADWTQENRRYALCFFPLVGVLVAAAELIWAALCRSRKSFIITPPINSCNADLAELVTIRERIVSADSAN